MLRVIDSCAECMPMAPQVIRPTNVSVLAVHRLSLSERGDGNPDPIPDNQLTGVELIRRFTDHDHGHLLGTGRREPYHLLLRTDGALEQMLPLIVGGQHVVGYNWCSWAIAIAGRYHERELPDSMWHALVEAVAVLNIVPRQVKGHSEIDPDKTPPCPGKYVNMDQLRVAAGRLMPPGCESWDIRTRLRYIARAGFTL